MECRNNSVITRVACHEVEGAIPLYTDTIQQVTFRELTIYSNAFMLVLTDSQMSQRWNSTDKQKK